MTDPYRPQPEHKFTFGLWTVGNPGRDSFGEPVRPVLRAHVERSARARVRAAEDHARDRPRRGAGAKVYVFWGGREGVETDASKDPLAAIKRYRDARRAPTLRLQTS